jgi:large subunit ribosomal protein L21
MAKIAIIKTGGKQYKVKEGGELKVEKLLGAIGDKVKFETLMTSNDDASDLVIGKPFLGEKVEAEILEQGKADKVMVTKYKNKIRYKRTQGHRQLFTKVKILKIN